MDGGSNGTRGKLLAAALVAIGLTAAVIGYFVRPLNPRPGATTQPSEAPRDAAVR